MHALILSICYLWLRAKASSNLIMISEKGLNEPRKQGSVLQFLQRIHSAFELNAIPDPLRLREIVGVEVSWYGLVAPSAASRMRTTSLFGGGATLLNAQFEPDDTGRISEHTTTNWRPMRMETPPQLAGQHEEILAALKEALIE